MDIIEQLQAIEDIKRLKADYFLHLDNKQWVEFEALFAPCAETDFREAMGRHDPQQLMRDPKAFTDLHARVMVGVTSMHVGHMPRISFQDSQHASGVWSLEDWMWISETGATLPPGTVHGYGHYHDRYALVDGAWKIEATRLTRVRFEFIPLSA